MLIAAASFKTLARDRWLAHLLLVLALIFLLVPEAVAQAGATTGVLRGTVVDPAGDPMAGAIAAVPHRETELLTSVETSSAGTFVRTLLPPGTYDLTFTAPLPGFGPERIEGVVLREGACWTSKASRGS